MNPNDVDLFAGVAGAEPSVEHFDLGHGVTLSKTYAHVFARFLIAFNRPLAPGAAHPAPWKTVSGGLGFDIEAELHLPAEFSMSEWFDRVNTVWWLLALMRLICTPLVTLPVIASESFTIAASEKTQFWPIEIRTHRLMPEPTPKTTLDEEDLEWVRDHWIAGGKLLHRNDDFSVAFQAFDQCVWTADASLAIVSLWGGLERIFFRHTTSCASAFRRPSLPTWSLLELNDTDSTNGPRNCTTLVPTRRTRRARRMQRPWSRRTPWSRRCWWR